jgi:HPt (histidine-containing phosphotransfer) domain-containing protein
MAGDEERCLTAGCTDYLTKPIDRVQLVATVAKYAEQARAAGTSQQCGTDDREGEGPIVSEFASDADMTDIIAGFVASMPARAAALREALDAGHIETLKRLTHQLKGAAGGFGFGVITASAGRLELACQQCENAAELQPHLAELAELCRRASAPVSSSIRGAL